MTVAKLGGENVLVIACRGRGVIWIPMQNYESLGAAVMICATVVNTQTDRQTAFDRLYCELSHVS